MDREQADNAIESIRMTMRDEGLLVDGDNWSRVLDNLKAHVRGPEPDPDTGLVPCGCGGKAKIWPGVWAPFDKDDDYEVGCTECAMTTGWVRGKQENAMKVWNTAMGWKGGSK